MPEDSGRYKSPVLALSEGHMLVRKARKFEHPGSNTFYTLLFFSDIWNTGQFYISWITCSSYRVSINSKSES